jgi:hypothetical protein
VEVVEIAESGVAFEAMQRGRDRLTVVSGGSFYPLLLPF